MARVLVDVFVKKAKAEGFVARSAFKLLEIQHKHHIIQKGGAVLDLGCSPGAWLQAACQALGPRALGGVILGIDLQETPVPKRHCDDRVHTLCADAFKVDPGHLKGEFMLDGFHAVLSDMCHSTLGNSTADVARSLGLAQRASELALGSLDDAERAQGLLLPAGNFVVKLLEGSGTGELIADLRKHFRKVVRFRPKATRKESRELYVLGLHRLPSTP